jgi:predicted oxidoreductase
MGLPCGRRGPLTAAGTVAVAVAVDQQGRVRRLGVAYTQPAQASLPPVRVTSR